MYTVCWLVRYMYTVSWLVDVILLISKNSRQCRSKIRLLMSRLIWSYTVCIWQSKLKLPTVLQLNIPSFSYDMRECQFLYFWDAKQFTFRWITIMYLKLFSTLNNVFKYQSDICCILFFFIIIRFNLVLNWILIWNAS